MPGEPTVPSAEKLAKQNQNEDVEENKVQKKRLTDIELGEKVKKFEIEFEKGVNELNKELFNEEKILITKNVGPTIEGYWKFIDETQNDDFIVKELLAREITAALNRIESLEQGIDPEGGFTERSKIMSKKNKGEKIEQLIDPQEAKEKMEKLGDKLNKIRNEIGGW